MNNYPSVTTPFSTGLYTNREQLNGLKNISYPTDVRTMTEYMRADFNPLVESLNFVSAGGTYDTFPTDVFGNWSTAEALNPIGNIKTNSDFRVQNLGSSDSCSRRLCSSTDYGNSGQVYTPGARRLSTDLQSPDTAPFDPNRTCLQTFDVNGGYSTLNNNRSYDQKMIFSGLPTSRIAATSPSVNMSRINGSERNQNNSFMHTNSIGPNDATDTHTLAVSTIEASIINHTMMTPDSSTAGFRTNKFNTSSDDGEISPTLSGGSALSRLPTRSRKLAPTLATGRRNLKGEPVEPDEADRRMKRRERNRKSAQKCRERKVQRTQELQAQVDCLQMEISRLSQERDTLRNEAHQFVALLQLHCPGVSIPYMSCLTEVPATMDNCQNNIPMKHEPNRNTQPTGWRMKASGKTESSATCVQTESFTNSSSRTAYTFSSTSNVSNNGKAIETDHQSRNKKNMNIDNVNKPLGALAVERPNSVTPIREPTSASSSSPSCSAYDLAFPIMDTTMHHTAVDSMDCVIGGANLVGQTSDNARQSSAHDALGEKLDLLDTNSMGLKQDPWSSNYSKANQRPTQTEMQGNGFHSTTASSTYTSANMQADQLINGTGLLSKQTMPVEGACFS